MAPPEGGDGGADLQAAYRSRCEHHRVKVNSIVGTLPQKGGLQQLDLSGTLVGVNGLKPLVDLVKECTSFHTLNLTGQQLTSEAVQEMAEALKGHPSLARVDISHNHCPMAGPVLVELVKETPTLVALDITECAVRPMFEKLITLQLQKNQQLSTLDAGCFAEETAGAPAGEGADEAFCAPSDGEDIFASDFSFGVVTEGLPTNHSSRVGSRVSVDALGLPSRDKRRPTVCSERWSDKEIEEYVPPVHEKAPETLNFLTSVLEHIHLFSHLDDRETLLAANAMVEEKFAMGHVLRQQDAVGCDTFSIVYSGTCEAVLEGSSYDMKHGDTFGEVQLLHQQKEETSITATSSETVVYSLSREVYKHIVAKASKAKREAYGTFLQKVGFLSNMTRHELLHLADALKSVKVNQGEHVIRYGEEGQWFFLIIEGVVEVIGRDESSAPVKVCEFKSGDCVGELEFINNHKCVADVRATTDVRLAKMNRKHFEMCMGPVLDILRNNAADNPQYEHYRNLQKSPTASPQQDTLRAEEEDMNTSFGVFRQQTGEMAESQVRGRRGTISAEVISDVELNAFKCNVIPKSSETSAFLVSVLERHPLFCHLEDFELEQLAGAMVNMQYSKGETVLEKGQDGDVFHVVSTGEVVAEEEAGQPMQEFPAGQSFGEVVLMYSQPHSRSYKANSHDVVTHTLDRATYKTIVQKSSMKKRSMYGEFLKNVGFLASCSPAEVLQLADALKPCSYKPGDTLIRYGDEGLWFFIIAEGCVSVHGRGQDLSVTDVCEFTVGDCVGELEFINKHKCVADVVAKTPVRAAKMHRHHFEMCLGPIVEVLKRQADTAEKFTYYRQTLAGQNAPVEGSSSLN